MMRMPYIKSCSVTDCAYNQDDRCRAKAITVGGPEPCCDTFMESFGKGGDGYGRVGACKVSDCKYNKELECSAENIKIASKRCAADCVTYKQR